MSLHKNEVKVIPINPETVAEAEASALSEAHMTMIVEVFEALADMTRAKILYALIERPMCVRDIAILVGVSESGVSHQLRFLRDRRLVKSRREGTTIYYTVETPHAAALFKEADYHVDHVRRDLPDHTYP